jgi:glutaconate CoA-transferase subunit A
MRAASHGLPFEPINGLSGSDIPKAQGLLPVKDPFTGVELWAVPAMRPDWAIIHVQEADASGNARILGSPYWDMVMARAASRVILTAEVIVSREEMERIPELTKVPHFLTTAVVHASEGARPTSCHPYYSIDESGVRRYIAAAERAESLRTYLDETDQHLRSG